MALDDNTTLFKDIGAPREEPGMSDTEIVLYILECRREAFDARKTRMKRNSLNRDAFMDLQDWSHKTPGQSKEFLPKTATAVEQFTAYVKRSLTQFGEWFSVELNPNLPPILTDGQVRKLIEHYLSHMPDGENEFKRIETVVSDAIKQATLESLMNVKVSGRWRAERGYKIDQQNPLISTATGGVFQPEPHLLTEESEVWGLTVDLIRSEDWFPDPTGAGLYEIHEVERDLYLVRQMAEMGVYDQAVVDTIQEDFKQEETLYTRRYQAQRGQNTSQAPSFRKKVVITEFWGTIVSKEGKVLHRNCLAAVANKKYLIRKPEPNPFWHQLSPFVAAPLIRVPFSVWHKALMDSASFLNFALNEMFNLMLDGGISAVWGIKQLRSEYLENPDQVANGIPQGMTLTVSSDLPTGEKVLESVAQGQVPTDAMAIFEMLGREFNQAALTNDIKLGSLPPRQVKATEILQADQSQAVTLDSISSDVEAWMQQILYKAWLNILQHMDDMPQEDLIACVGIPAAVLLRMTPPAERFMMFANYANFKVFGLTATLSRVRDFQKTMAIMQMVSQNPMLMQAFIQNYSIQKVIKLALKQLNINPDDIALTPDERENLPQIIQQIVFFAQLMNGGAQPQAGAMSEPTGGNALSGGGPNGGVVPVAGGDAQVPAEITQVSNPITGMQM